MNIRPAQARDLEACLALDESFETEYVWQMETTRANGGIQLAFRMTRLPRAMRVLGNAPRDAILDHLELGECFLVAEASPRIVGFVDATADLDQRVAWMHYLIVASDARRRGVGTQLLHETLQWAREKKLRAVIANLSTKNYPASNFLQKHGFAFCGFNDQYYHNRDIAMFFACNVR
jgi:ribosomal protein S18 acetylase RimI-like enzyme